MLKIFHMPGSRSTRIIFAAEELQIPYELDVRRRSELKRADVLAINPFGAAPVIEDGDLQMMESMAIVEYLVECHDNEHRLAPPVDSPLRPKYLQWLHYAECTLAPPAMAFLWASGFWETTPLNVAARDAARVRLDIAVGHIDDTLGDAPYIAGDRFTAADIGIYWVLFLMRLLDGIDMDEMRNVADYLERMDARPAARIAMSFPPDFIREPPGSATTPPRRRRNVVA